MKTPPGKKQFLLTTLLACCVAISSLAADGPEITASANTNGAPAINVDEIKQAYAEVQEQLRAAQLAIETGRKEAAEAAMRNAEMWSNRISFIEQSLTTQRQRELEAMRDTNRTALIAAGVFAGLGFIAMLITSLLQWRAARRMSEVASTANVRALVPGWGMPSIGAGDIQPSGEQAPMMNNRLLASIGQLEKLVTSLNHTATQPATDPVTLTPATSGVETKPTGDKMARITLLLGKGQSLLNMNQAEEAEGCFEEVLGLDGNNTEALVKKGVALERQRKLNEAIECYDRAIAADNSMTIAYLYKGGVYNRLERFSEALDCYEKALHTQEKRRGL